jgi:hypothetical protein
MKSYNVLLILKQEHINRSINFNPIVDDTQSYTKKNKNDQVRKLNYFC